MTTFQQDLLKIVLDRLLIGVLLAVFGFFLSRILEQHRANLLHRQGLSLQRVEACRALATMLSEFHLRYMSWIDDLESLLEKLRGKRASPSDIEKSILRWNEVQAPVTSAAHALLPLLPVTIASAFSEYLFAKFLEAYAHALGEGSLSSVT
jgi:hypothetical protein